MGFQNDVLHIAVLVKLLASCLYCEIQRFNSLYNNSFTFMTQVPLNEIYLPLRVKKENASAGQGATSYPTHRNTNTCEDICCILHVH